MQQILVHRRNLIDGFGLPVKTEEQPDGTLVSSWLPAGYNAEFSRALCVRAPIRGPSLPGSHGAQPHECVGAL